MDCICCQKLKDARNINRILTEEQELSQSLEIEGRLLLSVDSLITINNIILNANNLELRKHDVKPAGYNRKYMSFYHILPALTGLIGTFNDGKVMPKTFVETFLKIHPFADGNGRTCKILFM